MRTIRKAVNDDALIVNDFDDVVTASTWSMGGLTASRADYGGKWTSVIAEGGTLGTAYKVTNTVTLDSFAVIERSVMVELVTK